VLPSGHTMPSPVTTTLRLVKLRPPGSAWHYTASALRGDAGSGGQAWLRRSLM
jgi:hypothetical protein